MKLKKYITLFAALIALLGTATLSYSFWDNGSKYFEIAKNMSLYADLYRTLDENYVDKIEPAGLMRKGIDSMLKTLDPYTNYITEAQIEGFRMQRTGAAGNIGAELLLRDNYVYLAAISQNQAAFKAGLMAGDKIVAINGTSAQNRTIEEVQQILQGQPGSEVKITYLRPGAAEEKTVSVIRDKEEGNSVPHFDMVDANTAYIKHTTFTQNCSGEVAQALKELQSKNEVKNLILDLRQNGGGLLTESINMVNLFVPSGQLVVKTAGKTEEWRKDYKTQSEPIAPGLPLVILIDERSASASEIVSGTIQDLDRGVIVGKQSFGKGLVQQTKDIGYNAKLKLTVSKYYIPSGRCVQAIDYSGKYFDGKSNLPDSLRKAFKTRNGRTVYDGSGVAPDVTVDKPELSNITKSLQENFLIFDYATLYRQKHDSIAPPTKFVFTDADFADFVQFISDKQYEYTTESEKLLAELLKSVKEEKYSDKVAEVISRLKTKIKEEKQKDLQKFKPEITELLKLEIISRYYYQKGKVQATLNNDENIKKALALFKNPAEYEKILKGSAGGK
ncbi:MAG TPA: S41 family peptidase [Chitinophagales bacterium]|nr:S41 family peptidase [Chitinophagales bacterium]HRK26265.1 S41 family peptidase [Chitinophagales bacterium]